MKKTLAILLAILLMAGSAASYGENQSSGNLLKSNGFISGDENGNLNESAPLTRAQLMVLMAQLNGVFDQAKNFEGSGRFSDIDYTYAWYGSYIAYAEKMGWTAGYPDGTFKPSGVVTDKELATVLYKALGYPVKDLVFDKIVADLGNKGVKVSALSPNNINRGEAFEALWKTVNTKTYNSDMTLGVKLGKIKDKPDTGNLDGNLDQNLDQNLDRLPATIGIKTVTVLGNKTIELTFNGNTTASEAVSVDNYLVKEKNSASTVKVLNVAYLTPDKVQLMTEALTDRRAYTVTVNDSDKTFLGIKAGLVKPKVKQVISTDTNLVEVTFDKAMSLESLLDKNHYTFASDAYVESVTVSEGNRKVLLLTSGVDKRTSYKLTMTGLTGIDGLEMTQTTKTFTAKLDTKSPGLKKIEPITNAVIYVYFTDTHGVNKDMIENTANWTLNNDADVLEVTAHMSEDSHHYDYVALKTSELKSGRKYTVTISNLTDDSTAKNTADRPISKSFYPKKKDTSAPKLSSNVQVLSDNLLLLTFKDASALDVESLFDISNYEISGDLKIRRIKWFNADADKYSSQGQMILLETSSQKSKKSYKLTVTDIRDEFDNQMDKDISVRWTALAEQESPPSLTSIEIVGSDTLRLTFSHPVEALSAQNTENYSIKDLDRPSSATMSLDTQLSVTLTVPEIVEGTLYTITLNDIDDYFGNTIQNLSVPYKAEKQDVPSAVFEITSAYIANENEIRLVFSTDVDIQDGTRLMLKSQSSDPVQSDIEAQFAGVENMEYIFTLVAPQYFTTDTDIYTITSVTYEGAPILDRFATPLDLNNADTLLLYAVKTQASRPEINQIRHIDTRKIALYFSEAMALDSNTINYQAGDVVFTAISLDSENNTIVYLESDSDIVETTNLTVNLSEISELKSVSGLYAVNRDIDVDTFTFVGAPLVIEVQVISPSKMRIEFDREIAEAGSLTLYDESKTKMDVEMSASIDKQILWIDLDRNALSYDLLYTLEIAGGVSAGGLRFDVKIIELTGMYAE